MYEFGDARHTTELKVAQSPQILARNHPVAVAEAPRLRWCTQRGRYDEVFARHRGTMCRLTNSRGKRRLTPCTRRPACARRARQRRPEVAWRRSTFECPPRPVPLFPNNAAMPRPIEPVPRLAQSGSRNRTPPGQNRQNSAGMARLSRRKNTDDANAQSTPDCCY